MKFSFLGTKIEVTFLFAAFLCLMLLTDKSGLFLPTFCAVILHEAGHLFCMWVLGIAPLSIKLIPASVRITEKFGASDKNEIAVLLCGPALNFAAFLCLYLNFSLYNRPRVLYFAAANLILGAFNLLPVKGLDGGSIIENILLKKFSVGTAEKTVFFVSLTVCAAFVFLFTFTLLRGKFNPSFLLIALYIIICTVMNK